MMVNSVKFEQRLIDSGMYLHSIARKSGLTNSTITNMRNGKSVRPSSIVRVAMALGCSASDLLD